MQMITRARGTTPAPWLLILVVACLATFEPRPAKADTRVAPASHARASEGKALRFEPNVGQFEPEVRFVARGRSYALFLTPSGATLALHRHHSAKPTGAADQEAVVTMRVEGAASVDPRGVSALAGRSNYFVGQDPKHWRAGVQTFAKVRYEAILPGVDAVYYGAEGRDLEYDLLLARGVDPSTLQLTFGGISGIEVEPSGRAILRLSDGSKLVKEPAVAYQVHGAQRIPVQVSYELRRGGLGFRVGSYDKALPLVIDPVLVYATYFGGSSFDEAFAIAADAGGNTYIAGYTASTLFPTGSPVQPVHGGGVYDAFVVKLDVTGQNIVYSTYLGGSGADIAYAIATDALGSAYVAGLTTSTNFPTISAAQPVPGGGQDAFVTKLDSSGAAIIYSTYLGGSLDDYVKGIAVSNTGAAHVAGTTFSNNFPKIAPLQGALSGAQDAFVTQLTPAGSTFVYSTYLGGSGSEYGNAIALDSAGNAFIAGSTTSSNFPILNARQASHAGGNTDAFVSKLNATGSAFVYSTYLGGSSADEARGVAAVGSTAVVVGYTFSTNFPLTLAAQPAAGGSNRSDAFITRFDPSGSAFVYSTYLGGTGNDSASAVACDLSGNAYVVGQTDSPDLALQNPIDGQDLYRGAGDAFVSTLNPSGSRFVYTTYLGGTALDYGAGIAVAAGRTFVVGNTRSVDFPRVSPIINGLVGAQDAFVVKLPSIEAVAAPALDWRWLTVLAGLTLAFGATRVAAHQRASAGRAG